MGRARAGEEDVHRRIADTVLTFTSSRQPFATFRIMRRASILVSALAVVLCGGVVLWIGSASTEFVPSSDETRFGARITDADRRAVQVHTGLDLPITTLYHAYHFESALDQRMVVLVTMTQKEAEAVLAQPPLATATWTPASGLPTPASDLSEWPSSWGEPTAAGRRASIDVAPGRQLAVSMGEGAPNTTTLQISWTTY